MSDKQNGGTPKVKILIVEDDMPLAMMMASLLTRAGCEVHGAHTGEKAMRLAQEIKFDLITLDIDLPDMSGFEICLELKQRHLFRHTPIIFISARPCDEDRQRALELGALDYIIKPFQTLEFAARLLSHVKTRGTHQKANAESFLPLEARNNVSRHKRTNTK